MSSSAVLYKTPNPDFDEDVWGQVINGPNTYRAIAIGLLSYGSVVVGWTDEVATHYDLVFSFNGLAHGDLQAGLGPTAPSNLMVSIVRKGCWGFNVRSTADLHHDYVSEKLNISGAETSLKLANLIMGVRKYLDVS